MSYCVLSLLGLWYWNLVEKECLWNLHLRHHLKNVYVRKPKEESMCFFHWSRAKFGMKNDPKKFVKSKYYFRFKKYFRQIKILQNEKKNSSNQNINTQASRSSSGYWLIWCCIKCWHLVLFDWFSCWKYSRKNGIIWIVVDYYR